MQSLTRVVVSRPCNTAEAGNARHQKRVNMAARMLEGDYWPTWKLQIKPGCHQPASERIYLTVGRNRSTYKLTFGLRVKAPIFCSHTLLKSCHCLSITRKPPKRKSTKKSKVTKGGPRTTTPTDDRVVPMPSGHEENVPSVTVAPTSPAGWSKSLLPMPVAVAAERRREKSRAGAGEPAHGLLICPTERSVSVPLQAPSAKRKEDERLDGIQDPYAMPARFVFTSALEK
ncbi:hypothetical protein CERSUDRAFT_74321 [Gelatoporia subvermispora B]|uniref:Uncharacterized protein n=1 Tax=Ceriporiopsis subvermispora (strain B) TaxID=914234 RepID=M2PJC4_CERS8|nr:hypothetical protein CERSUDRAFT_74321 [Gelatoporia subvermispora B]